MTTIYGTTDGRLRAEFWPVCTSVQDSYSCLGLILPQAPSRQAPQHGRSRVLHFPETTLTTALLTSLKPEFREVA